MLFFGLLIGRIAELVPASEKSRTPNYKRSNHHQPGRVRNLLCFGHKICFFSAHYFDGFDCFIFTPFKSHHAEKQRLTAAKKIIVSKTQEHNSPPGIPVFSGTFFSIWIVECSL